MIESLSPFFADFAVDAVVGGAPVRGIFDNGYALAQVGALGMAGAQPTLTLPTAAVIGEPVGQSVLISGVPYVCAAHVPDGTGVSVLLLERAA